MAGRALLVGIDAYEHYEQLEGCAADAAAMAEALGHNEDDSENYNCKVLGANGSVTKGELLAELRRWLFHPDWRGDSLCHFSGHGYESLLEGRLVTTDKTVDDAVAMFELVQLAGRSNARNVTIILDCCHSGAAALAPSIQPHGARGVAMLPLNVSILAASSGREEAVEDGAVGGGLFTAALLAGLRGGAADLRGDVRPAGLFAYAQSYFRPAEQQPIFLAHVQTMETLRRCKPRVDDRILRELHGLFPVDKRTGLPKPVRLDPSWDVEAGRQQKRPVQLDKKNNQRFRKFKALESAGLLEVEPFTAEDVGAPRGQDVSPSLFWAAYYKRMAQLTPLGVAHWTLSRRGRYGHPRRA